MATQSKNLIFQVNIKPQTGQHTSGAKTFYVKDDLFAYSNRRAKQYADSIGAGYFCLRHNTMGSTIAPVYHKFYIYKLFELGYDKIFWIDSDAIFTRICPNVFDVWDGVCAVREHTNYQNANRRIGLDPNWHYFMSGQMMLDRNFYLKTRDHWRQVFDDQFNNKFGKHDQGMFNILVSKHIGAYRDMGKDWGTWEGVGRYIRHYAGYTKKSWTQTAYEQWEQKLMKKQLTKPLNVL
jgi:hypothetical protein